MIEILIFLVLVALAVIIWFIAYMWAIYKQDAGAKGWIRFSLAVVPIYAVLLATAALLPFVQGIPVLGFVVRLIDELFSLFGGYVYKVTFVIAGWLLAVFAFMMTYFTRKGLNNISRAKKAMVDYQAKQDAKEAEKAQKVREAEVAAQEEAEEFEEETPVEEEPEGDPFEDELAEPEPLQPSGWVAQMPMALHDVHSMVSLKKATQSAQQGQLVFGPAGDDKIYTVTTGKNVDSLRQLFSQYGLDIANLTEAPAVVIFNQDNADVQDLKTFVKGL